MSTTSRGIAKRNRNVAISDKSGGAIAEVIFQATSALKKRKIQSDDECEQRIGMYFEECIQNDCYPVWEELALYLGVERRRLQEWANGNGCSPRRTEIVCRAKEALASVDAKLAAGGLMDARVYQFRAKNFFGMTDQTSLIVTPNNPLGDAVDLAKLEERVQQTIIVEGDDEEPLT